MNVNVLVLNLQQLSPKQWRLFLDFVSSPYFNKHKGVIALAKYLYTCQPTWQHRNLDRKTIFLKCFPEEVYNFQRLKDLFSKLQKQLRHFISINHFEEQEAWKQHALVQGAFALNMPTLWQQQNKKFKATQPSSYFAYGLLEIEKGSILKQGDRKTAQKVVENQIKWLEEFFWKERFRLAIEDLSLTKVLNLEVKNKNWSVLHNLSPELLENNTIHRYQIVFQMLQLEYPASEEKFKQLLDSIKENSFDNCTAEVAYAFYVYALNYCTASINSGHSAYYAYIFEIYELLDLHGRLIQNETISQWTFLNVVATACNLKKFDWATYFIQTYHVYIPASQRKNALNYNLALLHFYKNNYEQALEGLQNIPFANPYYALTARVLELRIFYEKKEWFVLDALFERLRIYLMRNKILSKQRKLESQYFLKCNMRH